MRHAPLAAAALMGAALLLTACSSYAPPERTAAVRAVEAEVARDVVASKKLSRSSGTCDVRLLGQDGVARYAWVDCRFDDGSGVSAPVRVDTDQPTAIRVRVPGDGAAYKQDVLGMFPHDMANAILDHPDELQP
jgi:hypothetical protein